MKKILVLAAYLILLSSAKAQNKTYQSSSGEIIFSFAKITKAGNDLESNIRFSPVFNFQGLMNYDFGPSFGFFHGLAVRNVGFIYEIPNTDSLKKFRTYNIGIPLGIKLGNLNSGLFIFGGYEFEIPFNYRERTFINENRVDVFNVWFSNRHEWYTQSLFAGVNFPGGVNLKFKYYLNQFFSPNFTQTVNGVQTKPFENFNANVFYFALGFNVFKDVSSYKNSNKKPKPETTKERFSYNYK